MGKYSADKKLRTKVEMHKEYDKCVNNKGESKDCVKRYAVAFRSKVIISV